VQTCSLCHSQSPDTTIVCSSCQADLSLYSETAVSLQRIQENSRISSARIAVSNDCCPACRQVEGVYEKERILHLPVEGCSHPLGCRCYYQPILDVLFP
jgi:hypothetical protein